MLDDNIAYDYRLDVFDVLILHNLCEISIIPVLTDEDTILSSL